MGNLIFLLITLALLGGFVALTEYEARRGARVFARERAHLDRNVERIEFVLRHIDLAAFLRDEVRRLAGRVGHDIAHLSLQTVRNAERLLTRLVRHLRSRHEVESAPRESTRAFVKTLSDFKGRLKATHPEISDIQH
ncbi:MAG: hypothetical protein WC814_02640 [Candidatus Paceibacterota bacterium]|jgi:hypothetical protein